MNSGNTSAALSGALGGAASGALVSAFTNKKSARKLLKAGGLVALGGAAWHAYQKYQGRDQNADAAPVAAELPPPETAAMDEQAFIETAQEHDTAALILQAMIAAGYADGHLSETERSQIWQKALGEDLPSAALEDLQLMLKSPQPVQALAAQAGDMKTRIEVYTASKLAIDDDCEAGAEHLKQLAAAMDMPPGLVAALNDSAA